MRRGRLAAIFASIALLVHLVAPAPPASAAAPPATLCAEQTAAILALKAEIDAHNAKRRVFQPSERSAYTAYNAEAAELNARKVTVKARLNACIEAMLALADMTRSSLDIKPPRKSQINRVKAAKNKIPSNFTPLPPPPRGGHWRVPAGLRPLYDALRGHNPGDLGLVRLQNMSRPTAGSHDFAYPRGSGIVIQTNSSGGSKVTGDHIIPLTQIMQLPGFLKLTPQNMWIVTRAPINFQWLSKKANDSKSSTSVASMTGVDPAWQAAQLKLEDRVVAELQDIINKLLKSQK